MVSPSPTDSTVARWVGQMQQAAPEHRCSVQRGLELIEEGPLLED
jgi:hypothetical protein